MTSERLLQIFENPAAGLENVTYEELKTLALAYPYSPHFRTLLALKARQDDHPEATRALANAAAYAIDRTKLFTLMREEMTPVLQPEAEEILFELKPIESVQRQLEALEAVSKQEAASVQAAAAPVPAPEPAVVVPETPRPEPVPEPVPEPPEITPEPLKVAPVATFDDWINGFHPPVLDPPKAKMVVPQPVQRRPVVPEPSEPKGMAQQLAERSVAENKDVVSETLARLLARQGHREKAIAMYQRLCLTFPEKSASFAAEIEKLKKS
ncbi:MAG: hypothetical protein IT269_00045 [Saprospiraceae bacterium]|nr:hypothetical protein [Saprospiraceae bacterium]